MGPLSKMTVQKWGTHQTFNFDREHERGGDDDDDDNPLDFGLSYFRTTTIE